MNVLIFIILGLVFVILGVLLIRSETKIVRFLGTVFYVAGNILGIIFWVKVIYLVITGAVVL